VQSPTTQTELTPIAENGLVSFIRNGEEIMAIELYRQQTGCDVQTARSSVKAVAAEHGIS
jgi:hypothetical protein